MGFDDNQTAVYRSVSENKPKDSYRKKWTLYLILCCITTCCAPIQFGYNIGVITLPMPMILDFYHYNFPPFQKYHDGLLKLTEGNKTLQAKQAFFDKRTFEVMAAAMEGEEALEEEQLKVDASNKECMEKYNLTCKDTLIMGHKKIKEGAVKLAEGKVKVDKVKGYLEVITVTAFVIGGMVGALISGPIANRMGRKMSIVFHYLFSIIGGILALIAPYIGSTSCVMLSRLFVGVQGGLSCCLIPPYLAEISPSALRGRTGVFHQLAITIGIMVAQAFGFRQLFGQEHLWNVLLAMPLLPSIVGALCLLLFFPETPIRLLAENRDEGAALLVLQQLRHEVDVADELNELCAEVSASQSDSHMSMLELIKSSELRGLLIVGVVLQLVQQFCGVNAIFFYCSSIFESAGVPVDQIQYAVLSIGLINVTATIICTGVIDKVGRKPLLVLPMAVIVVDFIVLTCFLVNQKSNIVYSYLSITCIIIFIICFAFGLGPIGFIFVAESMPHHARSAALSICIFINWTANLALSLAFPFLALKLASYVFVVFAVIVASSLVFLLIKMPETKGRTADEINNIYHGKLVNKDKARTHLMTSTA